MKPIHSLTGLVAATHTPFKSDGSLNLAVVETQAARLLAAGVSAAFINGTTGECLSLSLEERRTLAQRWFEVARGTDLKISVHVGSNCLPDARALATQAEQLGATRSPRLPRATSSRGTSTRSLRGAPTSPPPRRSTRCDAAANPGQPPFPDVKDMTQPKSETTRPVKRTLTLLATLLLAPLAALHAADKPSLLPANWDPAQSGNRVMEGLVRITAPHVKGAHDAQFVCVGKHAYIVSTDNDVQPGHSAGEREYCVLSAVNLRTLTVEQIVPLAKSEQAFANVTLPKGMCFVPRILHIAEDTLRCYFASQPSDQEAVTWFRDFDMRTRQFEPSIHKAKLKTAAGTFDMEPRHFHADAVAQGFTKPPVNQGLYIFDSFKEFDGRRYVALNNFPGKQNALAVLHDDFATFEVIGHYNEPQSQQLSESAVNRLPDGTWMAIVRNDAGNYHFTTSQDGKTWSIAEPKPFVPNGLNSKPTFDKFGGVYYLGWQENTKIQNCKRSVFNVDISRDGKTWQRKYRFESPHSFQYPTFHEHEGTIWLTVTQSDHGGSSDRIMFGKLEPTGQFEPQTGHKRIEWPAPPSSAEGAIKTADQARVAAMQSGDREQLGHIFSEELRYAHSTGVVDSKASLIDTLSARKTKYLSYDYEERHFTFPAPGIALMTGRARIKAEADGTIMDNVLSFLAVWREEKGQWRFLGWQSCKLPPAAK